MSGEWIWSNTSAPNGTWTDIASDASGQYLVAVQSKECWYDYKTYNYQCTTGSIYTSSTGGSIWTQTTAPDAGWRSVVSSYSGQVILAAQDNGIYISTNGT